MTLHKKRLACLAILMSATACGTNGGTLRGPIRDSLDCDFCERFPDAPPVRPFPGDGPRETAQKDALIAYWETRCNSD